MEKSIIQVLIYSDDIDNIDDIKSINSMTSRPIWFIFSKASHALKYGDSPLDIQALPDGMAVALQPYGRTPWFRLDAMARFYSRLSRPTRAFEHSRWWRIPAAVLLFAIGATTFYHTSERKSDTVPWYIAPSYPSTFAPCIRSTSRTAPPPKMQACLAFAINLAPVLLLWVLESCRSHSRKNSRFSLARFPVVFLWLMPAFGVAPAVSLYFAIHYVESPVSAHAGVARTVRTALAAVVLGYLAPVLWALARFGHVAPAWSSVWAWLTFPVLLPATHELLTASFGSSRTDVHCPHHLETHFAADLPFIRTAVYGVAGFCTVAHAWLVLRTIPDWIPGFMDHGHRPDTLDATTIDYLALLLVSFTWLTLLFGDLKRAGLVRAGWLQLVLLTVASTLVVGPGTVLVLGWLIREEALVASHAP